MNKKVPKSFKADELLIKKFEYIAELESRNFSSQLTHIIKQFIKEYESENNLLNDEEYKKLIDEYLEEFQNK